MYREFLEMCAYTPAEIDKELPRIKRAMDKAGLTEADAKHATQKLVKQLQCGELKGMRMLAGYWFKRFVDDVLADENHDIRICCEPPFIVTALLVAAKLARPEIHAYFEGLSAWVVLSGFFDKLAPLLEAGESSFLPAGVAHCACNQTRLGGGLLKVFPQPTLIVSTGMYCDEAPKADEAFAQKFGRKVAWVNRCQDDDHDSLTISKRSLDFARDSFDRCRHTIGETIGAEITDAHIMQAMGYAMELAAATSKIADLRAHAEVQPLRVAAQNLLVLLHLQNMDPSRHQERLEMLRVLHDELVQKVARGEGVVPKGAPRIMLAVPPPMSSFDLGWTLEDLGLNVCCFADLDPVMATLEPGARLDDACTLLAAAILTAPLLSTGKLFTKSIAQIYRKENLQGVFLLTHYSCRVLASHLVMVKDDVKEELGNIPLLLLEGDYYDPRYYTAEQARTRIESFAEMVRMNAMAAA